MEPSLPTPEQVFLDALRRHRAELRESMNALEQALAAPAPGRLGAWAQRVHVALVELSADFREHIDITEGPDGLYCGLLTTAPRLSFSCLDSRVANGGPCARQLKISRAVGA